MANAPGKVWVTANTLHYCDSANTEWYFTGTPTGANTSLLPPGSVWISGSGIHYSDASQLARTIPLVLLGENLSGLPLGAAFIKGSANTNYQLQFVTGTVGNTSIYTAHTDAAHADGPRP